MKQGKFELFAFFSSLQTLEELIRAKIDGVIIDWEQKGKELRQKLYDTQVSKHTISDLKQVTKACSPYVICRINGPGHWSKEEIKTAIGCGANEILAPMIKSEREVEFLLEQTQGQVNLGLMLETNEALSLAVNFDKLPIHRFFVGLNDLSIQRKSSNIFLPFIDGTLDDLRAKISKNFGVAGLTHPNSGSPIPCAALINEMIHIRASFGFLRRSFYHDLGTYTIEEIVSTLKIALSKPLNQQLWDQREKLFSQPLV